MAVVHLLHDHAGYSGVTMRTNGLGGTESSVVQLAEALARAGHVVTAFNRTRYPVDCHNVAWRSLNEPYRGPRAGLTIAVNHARLFVGDHAPTKVLWLHNPTSLWKLMRRGNLVPIVSHRPHAVVLGTYHDAHVPRLLPFRSRSILLHGVGADFLRREAARDVPPPRAIFASQPYRGLDWVLDLWGEVRARVPRAELHVFVPKTAQVDQAARLVDQAGVVVRGSLSRGALAEELRTARVMVIPGHEDETYCLAAAEATALGVPLVTRGIGALAERVRHGETGFLAPDRDSFVTSTVTLLSDDRVWRHQHLAALGNAGLAGWDERAREWIARFLTVEPARQPMTLVPARGPHVE